MKKTKTDGMKNPAMKTIKKFLLKLFLTLYKPFSKSGY